MKINQKNIFLFFWRKNGRHFETGGHFEFFFSSRGTIVISYRPIQFKANPSNGIRVIARKNGFLEIVDESAI